MLLSPDQLIELWGLPLGTVPAAPIRRVCTDSRGDLAASLFVPLVGERYDGHRFLEGALAAGAAGAVAQADRLPCAQLEELAQRYAVPIWPVPDCQLAYQQLGRQWRRNLGIPVVAVTGSAGKTTTRELIRAALAPLGPLVASSGNENNDIGVPLTLLRAGGDTAALVVEMGMRGLGEIERLSVCAEPDVAVITNIGTAHIGRLGSREAIATAKCEITASLTPDGVVVIPAGDPLLEAALAAGWSGRVVRVALADELGDFDPTLPAAALVGRLDPACESVELADGLRLPLPLEGRHNARNLLLALAVARELGLDPARLGGMAVEVPGGRSRCLRVAGVEVLDETYNASPEAMLAALELLASRPVDRRFAVLGTMLELGELSLPLHRSVGERAGSLAAEGRLDGLVIVDAGAEGIALEAGAAGRIAWLLRVESPLAAADALASRLAPGDALLLKASRGVALEAVLPRLKAALEAAAHPADPA